MAAAVADPSMESGSGSTSALRENIERKGANSYYYAHANTNKEAIKATLGDAPRLLAKEDAPADKSTPTRGISKYAWADDGNKVKIYVDLPAGAGESLGSEQISCLSESKSLTVSIALPTEVLVLRLPKLYSEISDATAKLSKCKDKVIVTLVKSESLTWHTLVQGGPGRAGYED